MALPLHYNVRNVRVRWQLTLLAVGGIALVVAVFAVLLSMSEGFAAETSLPPSVSVRANSTARVRACCLHSRN